jgi:nitrate reductase molybdenum cofactor assembly chaperone NarJ/NarW
MVGTMLTYSVLSALLHYPTPELKARASEAECILRSEGLLSEEHLRGVCGFLRHLRDAEQLDLESAHVEAFDRGRSTSLHLFEHIHGDSRDRGQAMAKLLARYRAHGLELVERELPDYLPLFLEFLSTRPAPEARRHLAEVADIVELIGQRLRRRGARYAALLAAVASLSEGTLDRTAIASVAAAEQRDDTPAALDAAWQEVPVTFDEAGASAQRASGAGTSPVGHSKRQQGSEVGSRQ